MDKKGFATADDLETLVRASVGTDDLADYLTADHGEYLGVYADGTVSVGQDVGMEIDPDERPVCRTQCPGLGQADRTWWAQGVDDAEDMDIEELIRHGCAEGDVSAEMEDLRSRLLED